MDELHTGNTNIYIERDGDKGFHQGLKGSFY